MHWKLEDTKRIQLEVAWVRQPHRCDVDFSSRCVAKLPRMNSSTRNVFLLVLAVIAVTGVGLIVASQRSAASTSSSGAAVKTVSYTMQGQPQTVRLTKIAGDAFSGSRFVRGADTAPVTVVEFADYECPACGVFATTTEAQFKAEFIDTGKVRVAFRDFPLSQHQNAPLAAIAASCANVEKRWEAMHDLLFRSQAQWSESSSNAFKAQLIGYAAQIGLDGNAFQTCLSSNQFNNAIQADMDAGAAVGLEATPTFIVGGYRLSSALPIEGLRAVLLEFGVK